jgi:hypothetical protein
MASVPRYTTWYTWVKTLGENKEVPELTIGGFSDFAPEGGRGAENLGGEGSDRVRSAAEQAATGVLGHSWQWE